MFTVIGLFEIYYMVQKQFNSTLNFFGFKTIYFHGHRHYSSEVTILNSMYSDSYLFHLLFSSILFYFCFYLHPFFSSPFIHFFHPLSSIFHLLSSVFHLLPSILSIHFHPFSYNFIFFHPKSMLPAHSLLLPARCSPLTAHVLATLLLP